MRIRPALTILPVICLLAKSCSMGGGEDVTQRIKSLEAEILSYKQTCVTLRDSIKLLSFPADQRYNQIVKLVESGAFTEARSSINELVRLFPNSKEAEQTKSQLAKIEKKEAQKRAEEERIKALGYKVFKDQGSIAIGASTISFSGFTYGRTFTFDYVNDVSEYYYRTAYKGNTYVLANMSITTKENYADYPSPAVFRIVDGNLSLITTFSREYASWSTYGAYIGNYSENSHDFSKVNTVRFKLGAEISLEDSKLPLVVLTNKDGHYPSSNYTIDEVREKCEVIKILNRNKL